MDSIDDIRDRLARAADRYHNAADFQAEHDALAAAERAGRAASVAEAQAIEQAFFRSRAAQGAPTPQQYDDMAQRQGCLSGWFGGSRAGNVSSTSPWRSTSAYAPGRIRSSFGSGRYHNYTVYDAIRHHAPPGYPHPDHYAHQVASQAGLAEGALLGALTGAQVAAIADAIESDPNWERQAPLGSAADGASSSGDYRTSDPSHDVTDSTPGRFDADSGSFSEPSTDFAGGGDFAGGAPTDNS